MSVCLGLQSWCLAEFLQDQSPQLEPLPEPQAHRRLEALWELFTSEAVYFLDQLMVLKEVGSSYLCVCAPMTQSGHTALNATKHQMLCAAQSAF